MATERPARADDTPTRRPHRGHRVLKWVAIGVAVVVLVACGGAYALFRYYDGTITRIHLPRSGVAA